MTRAVSLAGVLALAACGGSAATDAGEDLGMDAGAPVDAGRDLAVVDLGTDLNLDLGPVPAATAWVVTSDFLAHTLTVWNRDALIDGVSASDRAVLFSVDLAAYPPGPLEHAVTPDGRLAVVAVGPGFLDTAVGSLVGATSVPPGGTLLLVDLVTRMVTHEVHTMDVPMSVAISPDGTRAFVACYGTHTTRGTHVAVVSLPDGALVAEVAVGDSPEQIELSADGSRGVVNLDGPFSAITFDPASVATSLSAQVVLGGDPDEAAFVEGTHFALIAQSLGPSGAAVLDLTDPAHPTTPGRLDITGVPYGATALPGTHDVLMPVGGATASLARISVDATGAATMGASIAVPTRHFAVPTHAALDADHVHAYLPMTGDGALVVVDLMAGTARSIPWAGRVGPVWATYSPIGH